MAMNNPPAPLPPPPSVCIVSECFIQPQHPLEESKHPFHLTPWDLFFINSQNYTQNGLLFAKPSQQDDDDEFMKTLFDRLKYSLSLALVHFYTLAGRIKAVKHENPAVGNSDNYYSFYVDCNNSPGVKFIHALGMHLKVSDILSPVDVPALILQSFFNDDRAVDEFEAQSLVTITVTEISDGVFMAFSINHIVADGCSFWHFINMWSEIFQAQLESGNSTHVNPSISRPPVLKRWFPDGYGPILKIPITPQSSNKMMMRGSKLEEEADDHDKHRVRIFHLSSESISKLKARANAECNYTNKIISSFQSLSAFVMCSITRARRHQPQPPDDDGETIIFIFPVNNRSRLEPPLSQDYFGNASGLLIGATTVGEVVEGGLGGTALKLHNAIVNYGDKQVRQWLDSWLKSPNTLKPNGKLNVCCVVINNFSKFKTYGNEFGMGKPLAFCYGNRNQFSDGNVCAYSGREEGSIDLEVCLLRDTMFNLESDPEFMQLVS